jgi:hypothetical protein
MEALADSDIPTIRAEEVTWRALGVSATPLLVVTDESGQVLAKGVSHRVDAVKAGA